jgi:hypothetical protein
LARIIYIRCVYGNFGRENTQYTVIYGVYIRSWPTLVTNKPGWSHAVVTNDCWIHGNYSQLLQTNLFEAMRLSRTAVARTVVTNKLLSSVCNTWTPVLVEQQILAS